MASGRNDITFMRHALRLARKGAGTVSPNPAVGALIVKNGRVLGGGYHHRPGMPHAEIEAIRSLKNPSSAQGATLYVTLEPCCTFGRTPPCCDAILRAGFTRVVAGCPDPNPAHAGRGFQILRDHGLEVTENVCEEQCRLLNEPFFHWIQTKRPFVVLKLAETLDGRIATANGASQWITGPAARKHVMELRLRADAVMAGAGTFRSDHPSFTARDSQGNVLKTPRRIVAATHPETLSLPATWETADVTTPEKWNLFLERLGAEQVTMLLIEGGGELAASALRAGIVNKLEMHIAPKILGGRGSRASVGGENPLSIDECVKLSGMSCRKAGNDFIITAYPERI